MNETQEMITDLLRDRPRGDASPLEVLAPGDLALREEHAATVLAVHEALGSIDELDQELRCGTDCRLSAGLARAKTAGARLA